MDRSTGPSQGGASRSSNYPLPGGYHSLELLRDGRLDRISEQLDRVAAQEDRVLDHSWTWHHDTACTEFDLNSQTHIVHACIHWDAHTLVFGILSNLFGLLTRIVLGTDLGPLYRRLYFAFILFSP